MNERYRVRTQMIRGRRYKVKYVKYLGPKTDGDCDAPHIRDRCIRVVDNKTISEKKRLVITIHEAMHACVWDLSEEAVTESSESIGELLHRLGYRQVIL